jgi:ribonuclease P protein component
MSERAIKKKNILRNKKEFSELFKNGKAVRSGYYISRYLQNGLEYCRIAVVIKKSTGPAVIRNYEKRLIKEFFRTNKKILSKNYDLVFIFNREKGSFLEKKEDFCGLLDLIEKNDHK